MTAISSCSFVFFCFFVFCFASEEKSDTSSKAASPAKKSRTTTAATPSKSFPSAAAVQSLYASVLGSSHSSSQSRDIRASAALEVLSSEEEGSNVCLPTKVEKFEKAWFDATRGCMVRSIPGKAGVVEEADMKPGDPGFLVAIFPGEEELETEVPNSLISLAKSAKPNAPKAKAKAKGKAKAKAKSKARAKAKGKAKAKSTPKAKAKAAAGPEQCAFERYYYTKTGKCGIRQKQPMRFQMFEFGDFSATKTDLYEIADQCITRLLANDLSKADAKEWCMQRFQNLGE